MRPHFLLAAIPLLCSQVASAETIRVCTTEWPPYTVGDGARVNGVHTEMVVEAFRRLGIDTVIENVAWERCWNELPKGTYQAVYSASYREQRAQHAFYPKTPLQRLSYVAMVRQGAAAGWDGLNLTALPQPLAAPRGYSIADDVRMRGSEIDNGAMKDSQNVEKLLTGRIGTVLLEKQVAASLLKSMKIADKVDVLPLPMDDKDYFVVLGRGYGGSEISARTLVDRLDAVLVQLHRERLVHKLLEAEAAR